MNEIIQKKMYLAGPMTGYKHFNFPRFDGAREVYSRLGYEVFSPADHDRKLLGKPIDWYPTDADHDGEWKKWTIEGAPDLRTMLGADLQWIASQADEIVMLPGWERSNGANAEWALAKALGLKIRYFPT